MAPQQGPEPDGQLLHSTDGILALAAEWQCRPET